MIRTFVKSAGVVVSALAVLGVSLAASAAPATGTIKTTPRQPKMHPHNSNTLHKIGKAIQYTTRKDTENLAVDAHKTVHAKSVVRNRKTGNNFVEKPSGRTILKSSTNPYVRHHTTRYSRYHHYRHTVRRTHKIVKKKK